MSQLLLSSTKGSFRDRTVSRVNVWTSVCYDPSVSVKRTRIMYIECKAEGLQGPARIGRVTFTKSEKGIYYQGREFHRISGFKANYATVDTHEEYWISGPHRDGQDRLYYPSGLPVEIDADVREEYWRDIRKKPELSMRATT